MDPWYSLGTGGDPLDAAHMAVHAAHMTSLEAMGASASPR